jgi:hypothetical protein
MKPPSMSSLGRLSLLCFVFLWNEDQKQQPFAKLDEYADQSPPDAPEYPPQTRYDKP